LSWLLRCVLAFPHAGIEPRSAKNRTTAITAAEGDNSQNSLAFDSDRADATGLAATPGCSFPNVDDSGPLRRNGCRRGPALTSLTNSSEATRNRNYRACRPAAQCLSCGAAAIFAQKHECATAETTDIVPPDGMRDRFLLRVASEELVNEVNAGPRLHPFLLKGPLSSTFGNEHPGVAARPVASALSESKARLFWLLSPSAAVIAVCAILALRGSMRRVERQAHTAATSSSAGAKQGGIGAQFGSR